MATLSFETLSFRKDNTYLDVTLLKLFSVKIPWEEVESIAPFEITDTHSLTFNNLQQAKAETKFSFLLDKYFHHLTNKLTGNKATYIHKNSGIPLIGNVALGIVYRNSSIIEIKPVTSCNLNCVYCSISEGLSSEKHDFVVEKDYLVEELRKLMTFVNEPVEIHIGVQGEPFLYEDIYNLIEDLQEMEKVHTISIDSNGTLLTKAKIDKLAKNKKLQLNLSLDAIDEEKAREIAGVKGYNVKHVKEVIAYASEKMQKTPIVAPVFVSGLNCDELEKIILFIKSLPKQPVLGIQNFLRYKTGKNPAKEVSWEKFYGMIEELEEKHSIKLKLTKGDFNVKEARELPKPFHVDEIITATIKCPERFPNSVIAVAQRRNISVPNYKFVKEKEIKVRIVRDKHNIFVGRMV